MGTPAEDLAFEMARRYGLAWRTQVNLEATINNMQHFGLTLANTKDVITDILDNLETIGPCYNKSHRGLEKVIAGHVIHDPTLGQDSAFLAKRIRDLENKIAELER